MAAWSDEIRDNLLSLWTLKPSLEWMRLRGAMPESALEAHAEGHEGHEECGDGEDHVKLRSHRRLHREQQRELGAKEEEENGGHADAEDGGEEEDPTDEGTGRWRIRGQQARGEDLRGDRRGLDGEDLERR